MFWNNDKKSNDKKVDENHVNRFITQYYSYCRTIALAHDGDPRPIYWETFCQPNSIDKWELRQVTTRIKKNSDTGKETEYKSYKTLKKDLDFQKSIHKLSQFERATDELNRYHVGETAEDIGIKHFIIVTELEGLLFDQKGYPHKILDAHIPATEGHFLSKDVEHAVKTYNTTKDLEAISELKNKDAILTLARIFNRVALNKNHPELIRIFNAVVTNASHFELALESIEDLRKLDEVYRFLNQAASEMKNIQNGHNATNDFYRWSPAKNSITSKSLPLEQFLIRDWRQEEETEKEEYQVENLPRYFDLLERISDVHGAISDISADDPLKISLQNTAFITEAVYNIIYANQLFHSNREISGESGNNIETIRTLQYATEEILRTKLNITSQKDIESMKQLIIHNNDMETPQLIKNTLKEYETWRSSIEKQKVSTGERPIKTKKAYKNDNTENDISLEKTVSSFLRKVQKIAFSR